MIELIPAIDIIDGQCVRLSKGDYSTKKVYAKEPALVAKEFEQLGFRRLHVVDLDGAKSGHVVNLAILREICQQTKLKVDFGGGVKSEEDLCKVYDTGAYMATVGSIAVTNPQLYLQWLGKYGGEHLILGADVRDGFVSINGWKEDSSMRLTDLLNQYQCAGNKNVLCTEISHDGMLQGPAIDLYKEIMTAHPKCHLIASGGVSCIKDIDDLQDAGIPAVVFGKAIYEGKINMKKLCNKYLC